MDNKKPTSKDSQDKMKRAEEWVNHAAEQLGSFASQLGDQIQKFAARAREEAEDIWAEAQHLRHRNRDRS